MKGYGGTQGVVVVFVVQVNLRWPNTNLVQVAVHVVHVVHLQGCESCVVKTRSPDVLFGGEADLERSRQSQAAGSHQSGVRFGVLLFGKYNIGF